MKIKSFFLLIFIIFNFLFTQDANNILYNTMNRLTNLDQSYTIKLKESKKDKIKYKEFSILQHWVKSTGAMQSRYKIEVPDKMRGVVVWEFRDKNYNVNESWMIMPVTGKLKNITKQSIDDSFNFSEALMLSKNMIDNHINKIIGYETIDNYDCVIIEASYYKGDKLKSIKKLWINQSQNLMHKIEFYNKRGRLEKLIQYTDFILLDNILIPSKGIIDNKKKKIVTNMTIENFSLKAIEKLDLFIPKKGLDKN